MKLKDKTSTKNLLFLPASCRTLLFKSLFSVILYNCIIMRNALFIIFGKIPFTKWYRVWVLHCHSFHSNDTWLFSINENCKLKNLFAKVEKVLTFLSLTFFKDALSGFRQFLETESSLKMVKNAFYFTLKALFVLKIFIFLS